MPEDGWMAIASCRPNYRSSPFWWIDFQELWPTKTSSEMALWNVPAIDRWTSEVIQHIQHIFVGVVFLGPSKKDSKKEPRFDQDLNIWCDYRGQPWSNFIPWISWRGRVSFVLFSSKMNNSPATKRTTIYFQLLFLLTFCGRSFYSSLQASWGKKPTENQQWGTCVQHNILQSKRYLYRGIRNCFDIDKETAPAPPQQHQLLVGWFI